MGICDAVTIRRHLAHTASSGRCTTEIFINIIFMHIKRLQFFLARFSLQQASVHFSILFSGMHIRSGFKTIEKCVEIEEIHIFMQRNIFR